MVINEIGRDNSKIGTSLDMIASGHFLVEDFVEEPGSIVIIRMYDENDVSLVPRWKDYAAIIDRDSLGDDALKEIDGC